MIIKTLVDTNRVILMFWYESNDIQNSKIIDSQTKAVS